MEQAISFIFSIFRVDFDAMTVSHEWEAEPLWRLRRGPDAWWVKAGDDCSELKLLGSFGERTRLEYDKWLINKIMEE